MSRTTCPSTEQIRALTLGFLSEERSDQLLDHLRSCESCQADAAATGDSDDTLVRHLRDTKNDSSFTSEPDCQTALAKALGALAAADVFAAASHDSLPRAIGEYEIIRPIGQGGMSSVYLAQHTKLGRQVALKVLSSHRLADARMRERFQLEMRTIGQLSHPNIVTAHDAREVDGLAVLVTELIDGLDVGEIIRRVGPLSVANSCEIASRIADALTYVDSHCLVHRDVKASNVMVSKRGQVKLLDLGLARLQLRGGERPEMTATGQTMGTADYVAPEQVHDGRNVDIRADVYSLGCTLFKMLTGRPPFADNQYPTVFAKLTAHVTTDPPSVGQCQRSLPAGLVSLVDRMLAKDPAQRPQSPAEIVRELASHCRGADLHLLSRQAESAKAAPLPSTREFNEISKPRPVQSFLKRHVPIPTAIAAGVFGLMIGFAFGVTITVKHPDGTATSVSVPDGSRSTVDEDGNVQVQLPAAPGVAAATVDRHRLNGVWRTVSAIDNGMSVSEDKLSIALAFYNGSFSIFEGNRLAMSGQYMTDTRRDPMTLDLIEGGEGTNQIRKAIYRFEGADRMLMCMSETAESGRPKSFDAGAQGPNEALVSLRRVDLPASASALRRWIGAVGDGELQRALITYDGWSRGTLPAPDSPPSQAAQRIMNRTRSQKNLREIGLALLRYHDDNGKFPASAGNEQQVDGELRNVQPHSWRVAILPYVGHEALFRQYRFDEPWDSERNLEVLEKVPLVYRHPLDKRGSTSTSYVAIVGQKTATGETSGVALQDIVDGSSNTLLVAESRSNIPWTKPLDLKIDEDSADGSLSKLGGFERDGFSFVMADGAVQFLSKQGPDSQLLRAIITRNGRESHRLPH